MKTVHLNKEYCYFSDIIKAIEAEFGEDKKFWFRGQANTDFTLLPSIFRQGETFGQIIDEGNIVQQFKQRYPSYRNDHTTIFEWLSLMQHYGLPTRILDWSTSLSIGLYFAVEAMSKNDGALYVLDPCVFDPSIDGSVSPAAYYESLIKARTSEGCIRALIETLHTLMTFVPDEIPTYECVFYNPVTDERITWRNVFEGRTFPLTNSGLLQQMLRGSLPGPNTEIWQIEEFYAVYESGNRQDFQQLIDGYNSYFPLPIGHLNDRIKAQHGVFTVHGGKCINGVEVIPYQRPEDLLGDNLLKITIDAQGKPNLLKELGFAGITHSTIFPDMEHVANAIRAENTIRL